MKKQISSYRRTPLYKFTVEYRQNGKVKGSITVEEESEEAAIGKAKWIVDSPLSSYSVV